MIWLYRFALSLFYLPYRFWVLPKRIKAKKEDPERYQEKLGYASKERPLGKALIWMHGASVGESVSLLPLIENLAKDYQILITTGTVTSAKVMEKRLPKGVIHQFAPLDFSGCVNRFLDHWHPDYMIWVESELWPNIIRKAHQQGVSMALVNMRLSQKSLETWKQVKSVFLDLMSCFQVILTQTESLAIALHDMNIPQAKFVGNLKYVRNTPNISPQDRDTVRGLYQNTNLWMAASTHKGEEEIVLQAHKDMNDSSSTLILAPRHPERIPDVMNLVKSMGMTVQSYTSWIDVKEPITADVFLIDTIGVLPLFYEISDIVFVGGSLLDGIGGHSILEPLFHGKPTLHGPYMANFESVVEDTHAKGAARTVSSVSTLSSALASIFHNAKDRENFESKSASFLEESASILADTRQYLDQSLFIKEDNYDAA